MIDQFIVSISTYGGDIDGLFRLITYVVAPFFIATEVVLFYFVFRFRHKPGVKAQYITGTKKEEKKWINIPHMLILICDVFLVIGAIKVWYNIKQRLPEAPGDQIEVIGQQWAWTFVHAGKDGALGTWDDITTVNELHVRPGVEYIYHLKSTDVLHCFSVPVFRLKQDAVPGRVIKGWFEVKEDFDFKDINGNHKQVFDVQCAEMCGLGHGVMAARMTVHTPEEYEAWVDENTPEKPADDKAVVSVD